MAEVVLLEDIFDEILCDVVPKVLRAQIYAVGMYTQHHLQSTCGVLVSVCAYDFCVRLSVSVNIDHIIFRSDIRLLQTLLKFTPQPRKSDLYANLSRHHDSCRQKCRDVGSSCGNQSTNLLACEKDISNLVYSLRSKRRWCSV